MTRAHFLAVAAAATLLGGGAALAGDPAYVGTWGTNAAQCKKSQETSDAPMIVSAKGYDSHETHCAFTGITKVGASWKMTTKCSVEGDVQTDKLMMSVKGKTLKFGWGDGKPWTFVRC